jgi:hypothetical protein
MKTPTEQYIFEGELYSGTFGINYVDFPFDVYTLFGTRKQVPVKIWIEGYHERKSLIPKGEGKHRVSLSAVALQSIGKQEGDTVRVIIEHDLESRTVEIPEDLEWLLDNEPEMRAKFERLPWSAKKFFTDYISQAAKPDVRVGRINKFFEFLARFGKKTKGKEDWKDFAGDSD